MNTKVKILGMGIVSLTAIFAATTWFAPQPQVPNPNLITVYKTPSCGCCSKWVDHLLESGFELFSFTLLDETWQRTGALNSCPTGFARRAPRAVVATSSVQAGTANTPKRFLKCTRDVRGSGFN